MDSAHTMIKPNRPALAGLWLMTAIPASILFAFPLREFLNLEPALEDILGVSLISLVHFASGYLWARSLGRRAGLPDNKMMNFAAGLGFALFVIGGRSALIKLDPFINRWLLPIQGSTHLEFGAIFVTWTGLVAAGSGLALGLGRKDWQLAVKLLGLGFLCGAGVFMVAAFLMDLLGFRVGGTSPGGLPAMPIVTLLGIWTAALVGSAVFGAVLNKYRVQLNELSPHLGPLDP